MKLYSVIMMIVAFAVGTDVQAQTRGRDADGSCIAPCARPGGRPCPPCPPSSNDGGSWSVVAADLEEQNKAAAKALRDKARNDRDFRRSQEYANDKKAVRNNKRIIGDLRELDRSIRDD